MRPKESPATNRRTALAPGGSPDLSAIVAADRVAPAVRAGIFGLLPPSRIISTLLVMGFLAGCDKERQKKDGRNSELPAGGPTVSVEPSGSDRVDALVCQLVSKRPAPYPSGFLDAPSEMVLRGYMTPEVEAAMQKLKAMGPAVFPALARHLRDDRYSYSGTSSAWENYTVGDAVVEVFCDGHYMHSGYKARATPSGGASLLSFRDYLKARGFGDWPKWAKTKTRLEIQMDFIDWCIAEEERRGFTDEEQRRHVLYIYSSARDKIRRQYSKPDGAGNGAQSTPSETNATSAAAGSRR